MSSIGFRTHDDENRSRIRKASLTIEALPESILEYEQFVDGLAFLTRRERLRLKLAGDEILDNLVWHAAPMEEDLVTILASSRKNGVYLYFFFRSPCFPAFASGCGDPEPFFDPAHGRWRGIGMVMCRNLSSALVMRSGSRVDRIILRFDHNEGREVRHIAAFPQAGHKAEPRSRAIGK
jgi:hypothetical protein